MSHQEILNYIQKALDRNYSPEQISNTLIEQGWKIEDISQALSEAQKSRQEKLNTPLIPPKPSLSSKINISFEHLSASHILLYLGALIVVIAGVIYVGINWSQWNPLMRIIAIFLPMLICYLAGIKMFLSADDNKNISQIFIAVGAILFPFFLLITFKELEIFEKPYNDAFNFFIFFLSFIFYFAQSFIFRLPIFDPLYQTAGIFAYYFFFKVLGVDDMQKKDTIMPWLMLIPGTAYLFLTLPARSDIEKQSFNIIGTIVVAYSFLMLFNQTRNRESFVWFLFLFGLIYSFIGLIYNYSSYKKYTLTPYLIGAGVIALSFLNFFAITINRANKEYLLWILILLGIIYFVVGIIFEMKSEKKLYPAPYIIGAAIIFLSLLRLGLNGDLLTSASATYTRASREIIGWSNFIIGLIYLLLAYGTEQLKKLGLSDGPRINFFFNLFGPLWILAAIFYLGLGGEKFFYETMLLIFSLFFIFLSIPRTKKQFLLLGTLFLIIYIFMIGGEYFQNKVGWPITLFVAGLLAMGIGIAIEKIRKKYFQKTNPINP